MRQQTETRDLPVWFFDSKKSALASNLDAGGHHAAVMAFAAKDLDPLNPSAGQIWLDGSGVIEGIKMVFSIDPQRGLRRPSCEGGPELRAKPIVPAQGRRTNEGRVLNTTAAVAMATAPCAKR